MKRALLIASFGTTHADAEAYDLMPVVEALSAAHPDAAIGTAFTSRMVIRAIEKRTGRKVDNEREGVDRLRAMGYPDAAIRIQSLHLIEGVEYEKLTGIGDVSAGEALFSTEEDLQAFAVHAMERYPEPVLFVGHGSEHAADGVYRALHDRFAEAGGRHGVATVEGALDRAHALRWLRARGHTSVTLVPLLLVAGDHAKNDIFGDEDSYKTFLTDAGLAVRLQSRGLGSDPFVQTMFLKKCRALMEREGAVR